MRILFLSRLHYKKGVETLLRSVALLQSDGAECQLYLAGSGEPAYEASLMAMANELGIQDRTHFLGFVSDLEKISLYQAADVFVLPTHQENWGFVFVESLACGLPVVTTTGVDICSELESSGGAVLVDGEPAPLAETLRGLLDDPARRREMGRRGRAWVLETLNPERVIAQYADLYRSVVETSPRER